MNAKQAVAVAELAVHLSHLATLPGGGGSPNAWKFADVAVKLTSLEIRCQRFSERCCNEPVSHETAGRVLSSLRSRATKLFERIFPMTDGKFTINGTALRFDVNGDPRGCCLKLYHPNLPKNGFGQDAYNVGA